MFYLLIYDVVEDYVSRRAPFRTEHLALANQYTHRNQLVLGGALADPVDQAVLLFRVESTEPIEAFVKADPYVANGLVRAWRIRPWSVAAGAMFQRPD
jgi:uncharacterized protein YciI